MSGDIERLSKLAHVLCDNEDTLYKEISKYTANGISYAVARQKVVEKLTDKDTAAMLTSSNNILAVEYLKAVIKIIMLLSLIPYKDREIVIMIQI